MSGGVALCGTNRFAESLRGRLLGHSEGSPNDRPGITGTPSSDHGLYESTFASSDDLVGRDNGPEMARISQSRWVDGSMFSSI